MMNQIKQLIKAHKDFILYVLFGGLSTVTNYIVYVLMMRILPLETTVVATVVAWVVCTVAAYITCKLVIFEKHVSTRRQLIKEAVLFLGTRLVCLAVDASFMFITADLLKWNDSIMKLISVNAAGLVGFFLSKILVFKKKADSVR